MAGGVTVIKSVDVVVSVTVTTELFLLPKGIPVGAMGELT